MSARQGSDNFRLDLRVDRGDLRMGIEECKNLRQREILSRRPQRLEDGPNNREVFTGIEREPQIRADHFSRRHHIGQGLDLGMAIDIKAYMFAICDIVSAARDIFKKCRRKNLRIHAVRIGALDYIRNVIRILIAIGINNL